MLHKIYPAASLDLHTIASQLADNHVVVVPAETVYGLAANAYSSSAVAKIYEVKHRPHMNPLIVHVRDLEAAQEIADFTPVALALAQAFWPGPLTMVLSLRDNSLVSPLVTAGLPTVAIRCPNHPVFQEVLDKCPFPLAAPSANPSQHLSATTAHDVAAGFKEWGEPLTIIDGGACQNGVESTIIDLSTDEPAILRPGPLGVEILQQACHLPIVQLAPLNGNVNNNHPFKAPGMMGRHYAPLTPLRLDAKHVGPTEALLAFGKPLPGCAAYTLNLSEKGDLTEAAHNLFTYLHQLDYYRTPCIAVMPIPSRGIGRAINDRLRRAACQP